MAHSYNSIHSDLRRRVPVQPDPEEEPYPSRWDSDLPLDERAWWREGWQATATPAKETMAKLIPIVTTQETPPIDAIELAQTYIHRWPAQENIIKDYLLPLGLEIVCSQMTKTGVFATRRSRDHVADLDLFSRDDHSINEEFYELPFLFEAGLLESLTHSLTKLFH